MNTLKSSLIVSALLALSATAFSQTPPPALERDGMGKGRGGHHGMRDLDTNKDSLISRDEAAKHPKLAGKFDQIDVNKDGFLSQNEMQTFAQANRMDQDGNGSITREEATKHPKLAENFDKIDTNKDGVLSRDEMKAARKAMGPRAKS
jgi:hypothetical protein